MSAARVEFTLLLLIVFIIPAIIGIITLITLLIVTMIRKSRKTNHSFHQTMAVSASTPVPSTVPTPIPQAPNESAPPEIKSFPETLKAHRTARHMSQEYLAEQLGVTRQAVSKWESGASEPSTANLLALAKLYGISLDELVGLK